MSAATAAPAKEKSAPTQASENVHYIFQEAMRSYEKALKTGIQLQEESVNIWKDLLTKLGSPDELQDRMESFTSNIFPEARKRLEEIMEMFNRNSSQTLDLVQKSMGIYQATNMTDAERRIQELIESSLTTLRMNVHTALNTNAKIISSWKDMVDRFSPASK